ncbi:MAG: glycosyltransferase [Rhodoluna sp.]|nr:glycosyltransferase [Rhodoluna sp.]
MASLNLLFVHEVSYEKKPVFEMHEFPEHLVARGHKVTFLQFDEGFKFWRDKRQPTEKTIPGRVLPGTSIKIVTPHQFGIPGVDRLYATLSVWPALQRMLKSEKFDAIVLYAVPTYGHQVLQLAKKYGVPVIFRALDVSHLIRKSILSPLIKSAENYVYKNANMLSANNPAMADYCQALASRTKAIVVNLPPLDISHFAKVTPNAALQIELGIKPTESVITYLGTFFHFSGLDVVIREFAEQAAQHPNAKILLIGGGEQDKELRDLVAELKLEKRVLFTGFIPYAKLSGYLSLTTVAINPMQPGMVSHTAFPHKVIQYMASGLPVVTTRLDGLYKTFGDTSGLTWSDSPEGLIGKALALAEDENKLEENSRLQLKTVSTKFGIDSAVEAFESNIRSATK